MLSLTYILYKPFNKCSAFKETQQLLGVHNLPSIMLDAMRNTTGTKIHLGR